MALIYLRIRANVPIVLLGETGIGKTALINLLSNICEFEFRSKDIHFAITEK